MATRLISCGRHGMVYRCDGALPAPVDAIVRTAPSKLQESLLSRTSPWCMKMLRSSERHIFYLEQVFSQINAEPVMPSVIGFWRVESENSAGGGSLIADRGAGEMVDGSAGESLTEAEACAAASDATKTESAVREVVLAVATDWVEGVSLEDYLAQLAGLLTEGDAAAESAAASAVAALAALAKAISAARSCGTPFVHGDIKPSNVIMASPERAMAVESAGRKSAPAATASEAAGRIAKSRSNASHIALVDFDTVSLIDAPRGFALSATPGFSAPECAQAVSATLASSDRAAAPASPAAPATFASPNSAALTPAADIYSFGACVQATLAALATRPLPDAPWVKQLETLASACMAPDPPARPSATKAEQAVYRIEDQFSEIIVTPPET